MVVVPDAGGTIAIAAGVAPCRHPLRHVHKLKEPVQLSLAAAVVVNRRMSLLAAERRVQGHQGLV